MVFYHLGYTGASMTAKEFAEKILALPEEQQNAVMAFSYYDDSEASIPVYEEIEEF